MYINLSISCENDIIILLLLCILCIMLIIIYNTKQIPIIKKNCNKKSKRKPHIGFGILQIHNTTYIHISKLFNNIFPIELKSKFYKHMIGIKGYYDGEFITHRLDRNIQHKSNLTSIELSDFGKILMKIPNAGGNSCASEILSYEIMKQLIELCAPTGNTNNIKNIITETNIKYLFSYNSPKTDYIICYGRRKIAVSVTRAMHYNDIEFNYEKALRIIRGKIRRINESNDNVFDKWNKQILHILTQKKDYAELLNKAFYSLDRNERYGIFIVCTIFDGLLPFVKDEFLNVGIINNIGILQTPTEFLI